MTFYNKQLKASYIPYKLQEFINTLNFEDKHEILKYFSYVSNFELTSNFKLNSLPENNKIRILSLIAQNIVRRGFPTLAPNILDKTISSNMSDINFDLLKESLIGFKEVLSIIDEHSKNLQPTFDKYVDTANKILDIIPD
ncbi:MAG: hypothetical protein SO083_03965 [Megamonas funiformis]|uniref:hypothetical protein n=1 Tax=Megamonas funiformis TaxID=437897 RepID=UPI002A839091|nr:hypothetical protein [Megamonas funiformis]MDY3874310.1 hypothetical protein [Megamonas funiformis]